jgi:hypothetical protein
VLAVGNLKYYPLVELKEMMQSLCSDLQDRRDAVNNSISNGLNKKVHPFTLPVNIYGTSGEWESYSSPSRDARFKAAIREIRNTVEIFIEKLKASDPILVYTGLNLGSDMYEIYEHEANNCVIEYENSIGKTVSVNLDQVIDRVFELSFDPYHCIELRWGANNLSELASCSTNVNKRAWYSAEAPLRNIIDRNYDLKMNKTLEELPTSGLGIPESPIINIRDYLNSVR